MKIVMSHPEMRACGLPSSFSFPYGTGVIILDPVIENESIARLKDLESIMIV